MPLLRFFAKLFLQKKRKNPPVNSKKPRAVALGFCFLRSVFLEADGDDLIAEIVARRHAVVVVDDLRIVKDQRILIVGVEKELVSDVRRAREIDRSRKDRKLNGA